MLKSKVFIALEIIALIVLVYFAVVRIYSEKTGKKPKLYALTTDGNKKSKQSEKSRNKADTKKEKGKNDGTRNPKSEK